MKLIGYEWRKLLFQKTGMLLLLGVWLVGQFLFFQSQKHEIDRSGEAYQEAEAFLAEASLEEGLVWLEKEQETLLEDMMTNGFQEDSSYSIAIDSWLEQYQYLEGYPSYIETVLAQADTMEQVAVFQNQGSFAIHNIQKTKEEFARLEGLVLQRDAVTWLPKVLSYQPGVLLLMLQILILAVCVFGYDQEGDRKHLLTMQYHGRLPAAAVKIVVLVAGCMLLVLWQYAGFLLQAWQVAGGAGDWSAPVQSLQEMKRCTWQASCGGFLLLFLLCVMGISAFWGLLASAAIAWKKTAGGLLLFFVVLLVCYLLTHFLPEGASWLWLKKGNPFYWMSVYEWLHTYENVSWFGWAVGVPFTFLTGIGVGIPACLLLAVFLFPKELVQQTPAWLAAVRRRLQSWSAFGIQNSSVVRQLSYQLLLYRKRFLLLVLAAVGIWYLGTIPSEGFLFLERATYNSYLHRIGGVDTADTELFLEQEVAWFHDTDDEMKELQRQLEEQELDEAAYEKQLAEREKERQQKQDGFQLVRQQWDCVHQVQERGAGIPGFFHRYLAEELFGGENPDFLLMQLCLIFTLVAAATFCRIERTCEPLLYSTFRGRGRRVVWRLVLSALLCLSFCAASCAVWYFAVLAKYPAQEYSISAACLPSLQNLNPEISMGGLLIVSLFGKMVGAVLTALFAAALSLLAVETTVYYLLLILFLEGPALLTQLGVSAQWFSLCGWFQAEQLLIESASGFWLYAGGSLLVMVLFVGAQLYRYWNPVRFGRKQKRK